MLTDGPWGMAAGPDAIGGVLVLDHLRALTQTGAYVLLLVAVGRRSLRRWPVGEMRPAERVAYDLTVGAGLVGLLMFGLALVGLLSRVWIFVALVVVVLWCGREVRSAFSSLFDTVWEAMDVLPRGWARSAGWVFGAGFVGALVTRALMPPVDWDAQMYQLPIPLDFLAAGGFVVPEGNTMLASVGMLHFLWIPLLEFASPAAAQLLSVVFLLALVVLVAAVAWRMESRLASGIAATVVLTTTMVVIVGQTARGETTLALFLVVGHLALMRLGEEGWDLAWVIRAGIVLGSAAWMELSALLYGVGLIPVAVWAATRPAFGGASAPELRPGAGETLRRLGALAGVTLLVAGPWLFQKAAIYGSPIYPKGAPRQVPPWMEGLFGTVAPAGIASDPIFGLSRGSSGDPSITSVVFRPWEVMPEAEATLYMLSPLLFLAAFGFGGSRRRSALLLAPAVVFVVLQFGVLGIPTPRYLIALVPALAIVSGLGASWLGASVRSERRTVLATVMVGWAAFAFSYTVPGVLRLNESLPHSLGRLTPRETLAARGSGGLLALNDRLEAAVPEPDRILMIGESRELYLPEGTLPDIQNRNWPLIVRAGAHESCLAGTAVTHVVVSDLNLEYYTGAWRGPGGAEEASGILRLAELESFLERCAEPLDGAPGGYRIFRLTG